MTLNALAATVFGLALSGTVSAQTILSNGQYTPGPQTSTMQPATSTTPQPMSGSVIQPTPYTTPYNGTTTYSTMPGYGSNQFFPTSMPGSTILTGTTSAATNTGATVVTGTRRVVRRGLGIFRR